MDIIERLQKLVGVYIGDADIDDELLDAKAEIERLREALKTFADNVRETNAEIDKNWAKTIYPLKAENQRLREALQFYSSFADALPHENIAPLMIDRGNKARAALKEGE